MNKVKEIFKRHYNFIIVQLIMILIVMILSYINLNFDIYNDDIGFHKSISLNESIEVLKNGQYENVDKDYLVIKDDKELDIQFYITEKMVDCDTIEILTNTIGMDVYKNDVLIKTYPQPKNNGFGEYFGYRYFLIEIGDYQVGDNIKINMSSGEEILVSEIAISTYDSIVGGIFITSLPRIVVSIIILIVAIVGFINYWQVRKVNKKVVIDMYYGILCIVVSLWLLSDGLAFNLLFRNTAFCYYLSVSLFFLIIPFLTIFLKHFMEKYAEFFEKVTIVVLCILVLTILITVLGIIDISNLIYIAHFELYFIVISIVIIHFRDYKEYRKNLPLMIVLVSTIMLSFVAYYIGSVISNTLMLYGTIIQLGALILSLLILIKRSRDNRLIIEIGMNAEKYKTMAYIDMMTTLQNSASFIEKKTYLNENNISYGMIMFDLNNLKITNDTLGHGHGNSLISTTAMWIKYVFNEKCDSYRIGGDEFVVILYGNRKSNEIKKDIAKFYDIIDEHNRLADIKIDIACGWYVKEKEELITCEEALEKAEKNMYDHKKMMKEQ